MKAVHVAMALLVLMQFALAALLYPQMPERMASHWNASGEVDGYMPKFWALFLLPLISSLMLLVFTGIPRIDPLRRNVEKFRKQYDAFIVILLAFLLYLFILMIVWSFGLRFNMVQALSPAFAALFYYVGILLGKTKRNWFIGIRTPWTLSSDKVWEKTHRKGSMLFKACGAAALLAVLLPDYGAPLIIVPVIAATANIIPYSYFEYRKR